MTIIMQQGYRMILCEISCENPLAEEPVFHAEYAPVVGWERRSEETVEDYDPVIVVEYMAETYQPHLSTLHEDAEYTEASVATTETDAWTRAMKRAKGSLGRWKAEARLNSDK